MTALGLDVPPTLLARADDATFPRVSELWRVSDAILSPFRAPSGRFRAPVSGRVCSISALRPQRLGSKSHETGSIYQAPAVLNGISALSPCSTPLGSRCTTA
jgi:hypothetical protein